MDYLLVTHIPFRRSADGSAVVDGLWAADLKGLAAAIGSVTVAAPEQPESRTAKAWGPGEVALRSEDGIQYAGLPFFSGRLDPLVRRFRLQSALRREVEKADVVHSSNFFPPYLGLAYAHQYAVRLKKKTVFVTAEDFYDFMSWNLTSSDIGGIGRRRAQMLLDRQDDLVRTCLATASVSFLHTPAAVKRYRLDAPRGMAIRQPVHEMEDVIGEETLARRSTAAMAGTKPLRIVAACRLEALKGLDFLLRALGMLAKQGVLVELDVFGEGSQREALIRLAATLGLGKTVRFAGASAPGAGFRRSLEACDLAAMPHLTNDFGRAFWDAMAAGLPVLAFHSDAATGTVRDRIDGLLAPNADVEGLADRIRELNTDRAFLTRMSIAARARALTNTKAVWNEIRYARVREALSL